MAAVSGAATFLHSCIEAGLAAPILSGVFWVSGRLPLDGGLFLCSFAAYGVGRWIPDPNFPKPGPRPCQDQGSL